MLLVKKYVGYIVSIFILLGCNGIQEEQLVDRYYLIAMDYVEEGMNLSYVLESGDFIGVVNSTVFAVGYNDEYIIVKQHPRKFPNPPDKLITNYFIVPIKDKVHASPDENKIGPLTKEGFVIKRKELGVSDSLTFTKVFSELE